MVRPLLLTFLGLAVLGRAQTPESRPLVGKVIGQTYVAPSGTFKVPIPVLPELGGVISDTEDVVTFQDAFSVHVSIAALAQDATQRWELSTRGTKEYLVYFFKTYVLPDFQQRFENTRVESARYLPALQDGALLTYILLPGGSMFADRVSLGAGGDSAAVAKRGNLVFVRDGHIFVISTELAERVLKRSTYKKTTEEEDELLRQRLLDLVSKMEFTKPLVQPVKK